MQPSVLNPSNNSWIKTLRLTLIFFCAIVAGCEVSFRSGWEPAGVAVPYPTQGYRSADDAFRALDVYIKENGKVDCLILGSSLVAVGIDPTVFEDAYTAQTGEAISCFNFGVAVATASSMGPLAHILVNDYNPRLLIFATAPRSYVERASYEPEENFQSTPWAKYHLGRFSLAGWALEHLYTARYISGLSEILFNADEEEPEEQESEVERPTVMAKGIPQNYSPLLYFSPGAPLYYIKNHEAVTRQKIDQTFAFSDTDFLGFKQIIQLDKRPELTLVVVEVPSPKYFFADPEGAPEPSEKTVFTQVIAGYARQQGVPFWMTTESELIPYTYFSDRAHMHASGAIDFSYWLGRQVGAAVQAGGASGVIPLEYLQRPPLEDLEMPRDYLASRGMSPQYGEMYQTFLSHFDLVPAAALVLNPLDNGLEAEFVQTILGSFIQWEMNINPGNVDHWFALMAIQDRMISIEHGPFSPDQKKALYSWHRTRSPEPLLDAGVDYLLYTEKWDRPETAPHDSLLEDPDHYRLIRYWEYAPLRETYYLYQPLSQPESAS